jgi:hypothetical protein
MDRKFGTVSETVVIFSDCLRALSRHVSKVGIDWRDGKNYDDWDHIAGALYSTIVGNSIAYTVEGEGFKAIAPYGMLLQDYSRNSFLYSDQYGRTAVFVKLQSSEEPFDTAFFVCLDSEGRPTKEEKKSNLRETRLLALLRSDDEQREIVNVIIEEIQISNTDV